jgi:rod shape-determining protein MreD
MRTLVFFLLGSFFITLQTTLFQRFPVWIGIPDLLFLQIVFMAIHLRVYQGAFLTLVFGVAIEVFSGYFLGLYALAYLLVFIIIKGLSSALRINEANHQPPIVALGYLLANSFIYASSAMLASESQGSWDWGGLLQRVLIVIVLVVPLNRLFTVILDFCDRDIEKKALLFHRKTENRYR